MSKFLSLRPLLAAVSTVLAIFTLAPPGAGIASPRLSAVRAFESLCSLYLDPHDAFTRVMPPANSRALRSGVKLATINVNYAGFTPAAHAAFQAAVDLWATQLSSSIPIVVDAQFVDLNSPLLLGHGGFRSLDINFPGAPLTNVLFPGPIANRLANIDRNGAVTEIVVLINNTPNWSYTTDGVPVAGKPDLMTVAMHELAHGLGYYGSANVTASGLGFWGITGRPYVYDTFVVDSANSSILNGSKYPNPSVTMASLLQGTGVSGPGLFWVGANGIAGAGGVRPRLFAPPVFTIASSYSHLDDATYPAGSLNSLMTPSLANAEVIHTPGNILNGMLADMGWGTQCSFALSPNIVTIGNAGGPITTTVSTTTGCPWTATTSSPFVTFTSPTADNKSANLTMTVAANPGTSARLITVQVVDQVLTISQAGSSPCAYSLAPTSATVAGTGGSGSFAVQTTAACSWSVAVNPSQVTITNLTGANGVGPMTLNYTVAPNPDCTPRPVTITVAGIPFVITQGAAPPLMTLDTTTLRYGAVATGATFTSQTGSQTARIIQFGPGDVTWTAVSSSPWLVVSPASGSGGASVTISAQPAAGLAATQTGTIRFTYTGASNSTGTITATLSVLATQPAVPFGAFDTPADGATGLAGSVPVTGWALDDIEVKRVRIMRDPIAGEPAGALVYVGDANLVEGARPDVQAQFLGLPRSSRAGWGYLMLTNFLPNLGNGTFRLTAIADDADGHSTVLGSRTITVANATATAPFGAIDTPTQGGSVSGTLTNFGWVTSAAPRHADPPNGGNVRILIDGAFITPEPFGWTSRSDLTALFPVDLYPGISTALGVAELDTTTMSNGVHTIAWVVTDDLGTADGVGSRYFTVANAAPPINGSCGPASTEALRAPVSTSRSIEGRVGYAGDTAFRTFKPGADGRITIESEEVDRVELRLGRGAAGSQRVAGQLRPLPAGSHIDAQTGVFTWQPGVGFVGAYDFVLGGRDVRIVLNPKRSHRGGVQLVIDTPRPAYDASGSFVVAGWAADLDSAFDGGVDTVHVWAYPAAGGAPIFIGAAAFGGERPDVAAIYGERFGRSGYGIDVSGLAPGDYDIAVFAYSTVSGGFAPAKTVRVTVR